MIQGLLALALCTGGFGFSVSKVSGKSVSGSTTAGFQQSGDIDGYPSACGASVNNGYLNAGSFVNATGGTKSYLGDDA
jgi:hypothetical protein